jgi:hypothetical protein
MDGKQDIPTQSELENTEESRKSAEEKRNIDQMIEDWREMDNSEETIDSMETHIRTVEEDLDNAKSSNLKLRNQIMKMEKENKEKTKAFEEQLRTLKSENEKWRNQKNELDTSGGGVRKIPKVLTTELLEELCKEFPENLQIMRNYIGNILCMETEKMDVLNGIVDLYNTVAGKAELLADKCNKLAEIMIQLSEILKHDRPRREQLEEIITGIIPEVLRKFKMEVKNEEETPEQNIARSLRIMSIAALKMTEFVPCFVQELKYQKQFRKDLNAPKTAEEFYKIWENEVEKMGEKKRTKLDEMLITDMEKLLKPPNYVHADLKVDKNLRRIYGKLEKMRKVTCKRLPEEELKYKNFPFEIEILGCEGNELYSTEDEDSESSDEEKDETEKVTEPGKKFQNLLTAKGRGRKFEKNIESESESPDRKKSRIDEENNQEEKPKEKIRRDKMNTSELFKSLRVESDSFDENMKG